MTLSSMTGFGRGEAPLDGAGRRVVVELKAVNHRFLELKVRCDDAELESELGKLVRGRLHRGAVSLTVREDIVPEQSGQGDRAIDEAKAKHWAEALRTLAKAIDVPPPSLELVCAQPGVLRPRAVETDRDVLVSAARKAADQAITALLEARRREGGELMRDLVSRLDRLAALREEVGALATMEPRAHLERMRARLAVLLEDRPGAIDPQRLAQEVALLAEKLDVAEELVRLGAHLDEARRLLAGKEPAGRRLDFLSQEIHREVNTIGSKSQSTDLATRIIDMKAELERFREQVQNVE